MKVLVAGATGSVGSRLVPQLVERGHEVVGTSRSASSADRLRALGATPVVLDVLDPGATRDVVADTKPDAIVHEATALAGKNDLRHFDESFAGTNRLRTDGTDNLIAAARETGVSRLVAQSYAGWPYAREGGPVKSEDDRLDPSPVPEMRETLDAIEHLERRVTDAGGTVLRYGGLYGAPDDVQVELVRKRRFPIVGDGGGVWSFVHLDDAASATVLAVEQGDVGIYNVVDSDPAPVSEWLPALAETVHAKPPRHVPRWVARLVAGDVGVVLMTEVRGASNAKARHDFDWTLRHPSWREGFESAYGE
jgi:nucleoside-diphosphate-sugar epimerase